MDKVRLIRTGRKDTLEQLAAALSEAVGKERPWTHGTVSNFLTEDPTKSRTTIEMADAFCALYGVPPFLFRIKAGSLDEAVEIAAVVSKWSKKDQRSNPEAPVRVIETDQRAAALRKAAHDQRQPVKSKDERPGRRRRP